MRKPALIKLALSMTEEEANYLFSHRILLRKLQRMPLEKMTNTDISELSSDALAFSRAFGFWEEGPSPQELEDLVSEYFSLKSQLQVSAPKVKHSEED